MLRPDVHFAALNEVCLVCWDTAKRVVGVDQAPVLGRGAVVVEWVVLLEGGAVVEVEPLAFAAVQVLHVCWHLT